MLDWFYEAWIKKNAKRAIRYALHQLKGERAGESLYLEIEPRL